MTEATWQPTPTPLADDEPLAAAVLAVHGELLETLGTDPGLNLALGMEMRALRRIEDWRVLLLLTPWMLARLLFHDARANIAVPPDWSAERRADADYVVLGPTTEFELLGQPQRAHINYHPRLGHYLLQPICLDMAAYPDAASVFERWNEVIRIRDDNMAKAQRDCPMQKEVSRREFFRRFRGDNPV